MGKRNRRRTRNKAKKILLSGNIETPARIGPGQVLQAETFAEKSVGDSTRLRNIGEHPLTLLYHRKKITEPEFRAGDHYRKLFAMRERGGFAGMADNGGGGTNGVPFTQSQVDAIRAIERIEAGLGEDNVQIVRKFCGEGHSGAHAVHTTVRCHKDGVLERLCEALDALGRAIDRVAKRRAA